ncbi:unnamed protein product [Absidia cylindrospora]
MDMACNWVGVATSQDTKRHSVVTLFDEDLSQWMDNTSFGSQRQIVKKLGQQLELSRQQQRRNEQGNNIWLFHVRENTLVLSAEALLPLPKSSMEVSLSDQNQPTGKNGMLRRR